MKALELNNYGVQEMNAVEMQKVDGGIGPLIVLAVIAIGAIASGCNNTVNVNIGSGSATNTTQQDSVSVGNGNSTTNGHGNGNSVN